MIRFRQARNSFRDDRSNTKSVRPCSCCDSKQRCPKLQAGLAGRNPIKQARIEITNEKRQCTMSVSSTVTQLAGNFGRLWRRGHESFTPDTRRILSVQGKGATTYLQGLVTSDLLSAPPPPREEQGGDDEPTINPQEANTNAAAPPVEFSERLRSTCFLDNKGRIVTDSLLWKLNDEQYYIDVPGSTGDLLLAHLKQFVLRKSQVKITDQSSTMTSHVVFGTQMAHNSPPGYLTELDPRHPSLGMRVLALPKNNENDNNDKSTPTPTLTTQQFQQLMSRQFPESRGSYNVVRKLAGVAEGSELTGRIALETNQEFLNAVSFKKGCYLGQELTARVQFTGAIRKRILPILLTTVTVQVPQPWILASQIQQGRLRRPEGEDEEEDEDDKDDNDKENGEDMDPAAGISDTARTTTTTIQSLPRLPRISAPAAGAMVAMMTESLEEHESKLNSPDELPSPTHEPQLSLSDRIQQLQPGDKIIDVKNGRTIGQVVAGAEPGTNVVLAQLRLDAVGLLGTDKDDDKAIWSHLNKVTIGDDSLVNKEKFRYLPYLPLWWPDIDPATGKAKE
jgi:transferase CAF17, mitochondrial